MIIEDMPDDATLGQLGIESAWELTGIYRGTPLTEPSSGVSDEPSVIVLYRQPILFEWVETSADLYKLVRTALVHHVAHHFGFNNSEIEATERKEE